MTITLCEIRRYPVKSMSGEALPDVELSPGAALAGDRRFALVHGSARYDPASGEHLSHRHCVTLKQEERLAQLTVRFDPDSGILLIERQGRQLARGEVTTPLGQTLISEFFARFLGSAPRGLPRLVEARGRAFTDSEAPLISIVNLASVRDLERVARQPIDPRRFRGNLWLDGAPAWSEFGWVGREIAIAETRLRVVARIDRCAATNVDPDSAKRDINLPLLQRGFGHIDFGVYAEVLGGGRVACGDPIAVPDSDRPDLPF